jgi:tRNA(adenine34) deaminase
MYANHIEHMNLALSEAKFAAEKAEVPIGAVLVSQDGVILAQSHNQPISLNDPTAHAEMLTLRKAAQKAQNYRLLNTILYVTIEPCIMCMGALVHARVSRLVYGARDSKWGGAGSLYDLAGDNRLNHRMEIIAGVCEDECRALIQDFFRSKRK